MFTIDKNDDGVWPFIGINIKFPPESGGCLKGFILGNKVPLTPTSVEAALIVSLCPCMYAFT
eukprot:m.267926 g.267926  ORF g.267926 m.267926 type:complete len:62 (+) comp16253_c0_seq1:458-643(+)